MSPASTSDAVPVTRLRWTQAPPIVRLWAFWFTLFTLFVCGMAMVWGVTQFASSTSTGIVMTGGGLLLSVLFGVHLLALRKGWGFSWTLQLLWAGVFLGGMVLSFALKMGLAPGTTVATRDKFLLGLLVVPALIHLWIVAHWFKAEVKAWFGRLAPAMASK